MCLPRLAARGRGGESRGGRSGLFYSLPCLPPNRSGTLTCGRLFFETVPAGGPTINGFSGSFIARIRTTLSLCPFGRTVGGKVPAARGSTGCTLNLDKSKRSILLKQARTQRSVF